MKRRIVQADWYWPTIWKIAEGHFRKGETKTDLLRSDIKVGPGLVYLIPDRARK